MMNHLFFQAQGFSNNLAGFTAEFHVACTAPDVVALSQKFQVRYRCVGEYTCLPPKPTAQKKRHTQLPLHILDL